MKAAYQVTDRRDSRVLAEFFSGEGSMLVPWLELIENAELAEDELIDTAGRATIEAVLTLSVPKIPTGLIGTRQRPMGCGERQEICERQRRNVRSSGLFAAFFLGPRRGKPRGAALSVTPSAIMPRGDTDDVSHRLAELQSPGRDQNARPPVGWASFAPRPSAFASAGSTRSTKPGCAASGVR